MLVVLGLYIILPIVSTFTCALRWGGNGILGSFAGLLTLAFALSLTTTLIMGQSPMLGPTPLYARAGFLAASFSFQGILWCLVGTLGGYAGIRLRRRRAKAISSKTAAAFD